MYVVRRRRKRIGKTLFASRVSSSPALFFSAFVDGGGQHWAGRFSKGKKTSTYLSGRGGERGGRNIE